MNREASSAPVPERDKQAEEDLWQRHKAERGVWTKPMLAALARGLKGNKWFSLIDKISTERTLQLAWEKVRRNAGSCGVDGITCDKTELLIKANEGIEMTRGIIRMAHDRKLLAPKQCEFSALQLNECGRMVGGWLKSRGGGFQPPSPE